MSQWGALGQARNGRSYRQILAHYYRETTIGEVPASRVRVLLAEGAPSLRISSDAAFRIRDARGRTHRLPAGELTLESNLRLTIGGKPTKLAGPLRLRPDRGAPLALDGLHYRGELLVAASGGRLSAINVVALQPYLMGVVAREMPFDWPLEALKAQAVAARSYALARREKGKPFDLYADWRSQVYGGVAAETPETTRAVRETAGEILTYGGTVATTLFHSTSGGRTAAAEDVYGPAFKAPYLVSVRDPWDTPSPHHDWEPRALTPVLLGRALGLGAPVADVVTEKAPSGRVTLLRAETADGRVLELTGQQVRDALGLRSTWFRIGILRLGSAAGRVEAGTRLELSGVARDVDSVELQQLRDGAWAPARRVQARSDGTFSLVVRPVETVRYRLAAGELAGAPVTVKVVSRSG
jgi:stage II sporulation protein D